jgi:hypothetical protein
VNENTNNAQSVVDTTTANTFAEGASDEWILLGASMGLHTASVAYLLDFNQTASGQTRGN